MRPLPARRLDHTRTPENTRTAHFDIIPLLKLNSSSPVKLIFYTTNCQGID